MEQTLNYYEELEVSRNASQEVIRAAYKNLVQRYHPDKNNGETHERLARITEAYRVLSDPEARKKYDEKYFFEELADTTPQPLTTKVEDNERLPSGKNKPPKKWPYALLLGLAITAYGLYQYEQYQNEKIRIALANAEYENQQRKIKEQKELNEKRKEYEALDLKNRTITFQSSPQVIVNRAPQYSYSHCSEEQKSFILPGFKITIGQLDSQKIKGSVADAKNTILTEISKSLRSIHPCNLFQVDFDKKVEGVIKDTANRMILGFEDYAKTCREMPYQEFGEYRSDVFYMGRAEEMVFVCRGVVNVIFDGEIRVL